MEITVLQGKIHRATVTDSRLDYEGSVTIDKSLLDLAGFVEYQQVQIYNIANGHRFETYTIVGPADSGIIQVNGAAAHLAKKGDLIIIAGYGQIPVENGPGHKPNLVFVDQKNRPAVKPEMMPV